MEVAPKLLKPHGVIFLHADVDICLERIANRDKATVDMYERKSVLERVMEQWKTLSRYLTDTKVLELDTTLLTQEEVFDRVRAYLERWGITHGD